MMSRVRIQLYIDSYAQWMPYLLSALFPIAES